MKNGEINQNNQDPVRDEARLAEVLGGFGGLWRYPDALDYFFLVNPYFPPKRFTERMRDMVAHLFYHYPSNRRVDSELASAYFGVRADSVIVGNGTSELIKEVVEHLEGKVGIIRPTFEEYPNRCAPDRIVTMQAKAPDYSYTAGDVMTFFSGKDVSAVVLVNPDNPSGNYIPKKDLLRLADWAKTQAIRLIVDESFADFAEEDAPSLIRQDVLDEYPNLLVLKSISKSYGVPGIRLGVIAGGDKAYMDWLKKDLSIWNINSFAEYFLQIISDYHDDYVSGLSKLKAERKRFAEALSGIPGLRVLPSEADYLMVELTHGVSVKALRLALFEKHNILIKDLSSKVPEGQFMRLAIRDRADNEVFVRTLKEVLSEMTERR